MMDVLDDHGVDVSAAMQHVTDLYASRGHELDLDAAWEEVICNTAPAFLQDKEIVRDLISRDRTMVERFADTIREIVDKMSSVLNGLGDDMSKLEGWKGMQALKDDHESLRKIYDCLMEGLEETSRQDGSTETDTKWSLKDTEHMSWKDQVLKVIDGTIRRSANLNVAKSGDIMSVFGMAAKPIGMNISDLNKIMREAKGSRSSHAIPESVVLAFSDELNNPKVVFDNQQRNCLYVVMSQKGKTKNPVVAVIHKDQVDPVGNPMHQLKSAYEMDNPFQYMMDHLPRGSNFYAESNEALLQAMAGAQSSIDAADIHALEERFNRIVIKTDDSVNMKNSLRENIDGVDVVNGSVVKYSLRSWTDQEQEKARKELVKSGYEKEAVDSWISDVNSVASIVASDKTRLDFEADPDQVMLKNNEEYYKTLDASTLCAKRLLYQGTFNAIQHRLPGTVMTSDRLLDLLNMMKDAGYETPCGICYVESRRRHLGKFADQWLNGRPATKDQKAWAPYSGDYIPTLDELTTTDGLAKLKANHPETYQDFVDKMASLGSSNPKIVELRTDYRGDIRKINKATAEKIRRIGGLRVQSFSDFETPHMLDMMQAVLDMTSKNLTSQAYTKVPNFAWVFGDTGIKINLSLIAEGNGLDENGNLIFSSSEGMDISEALKLRERYSENVGTIIVGANDAHIKAAMADPRIDFIIPFHRSGWGQNELKKVGVLQEYTDYQASQNERIIKGYKKNGSPDYGKPEGGNFYPIDYWDYSKTGDENAATYLRMCEEDGRVPKFDQFLTKDADGHWEAPSGYWKLLIDFKMYDNDGNGAPQKTVQPKFNMTEARRVLDEYQGGANELPVAQDIVDRFVDEIEAEEAEESNEENMKFSLRETDETVQEGLTTLGDLFHLTSAHRMTDKEAMYVARRVKKAAQSDMNTEELAGKVKHIYDYVERGGKNVSLENVDSEQIALAEEVMATSKTLDMEHEERMKPIRNYLRTTPIQLTDAQKQEAAGLVGSIGEYRRMVFGRARIVNNGTKLDSLWPELSAMDAKLFPPDAGEAEMAAMLLDAVDAMAPVYQNGSGLNAMESAQWLAGEMNRAYLALAGVQAAAKEQQELGIKLNQYRKMTERFATEHKAAFDEVKAKLEASVDAEKERLNQQAEANRRKDRMEAKADAAAYAKKQIAAVEAKAAQEKAEYREAMQAKDKAWREKYKADRKETSRKQRYRAQILRMTNDLLKKLEKPTDKKHVKAGLDKAVMDFLGSLELGGKNKTTQDLHSRIVHLQQAVKNAQEGNDGNTDKQYLIRPELLDDMATLSEEVKGLGSMAELTADQMRDMRDMIREVTHIVSMADQMFTMGKNATIAQMGDQTREELSQKKDKKDRKGYAAKMDEMLNTGMLDSFHAFDLLGPTGREIHQKLREGLDKRVQMLDEAAEFAREACKGLDKAVLKGAKAKKSTYTVAAGSIELTKAQVMGLYCLSRREEAKTHLYNGGIRTKEHKIPLKVTEAEVKQITDTLTDKERQVAEALQEFLTKICGKWGNDASLILFGYERNSEGFYFPMNVDKNTVQTKETEEGKEGDLMSIIYPSFTKALKQNANNPLMIEDIFDVFTKHVSEMSAHSAFAAPLADLLRWYNYKPKDVGPSVKTMIEAKFGVQMQKFITTLIRDLNGSANSAYTPGFAENFTKKAKSASVGFNAQVVIQQLSSIVRANVMMSPKYVLSASKTVSPKKLAEAKKLALQYCPIAKWKSMGFYETNLGKNLRDMMFDGDGVFEALKELGNKAFSGQLTLESVKNLPATMFGGRSIAEGLTDAGMLLAGKMDELTFSKLWIACEQETQDMHSELQVGSDEYYQHVGKRLSEIIDYTQVVDSPLHRTQMMRSKNFAAQSATAFMSEPMKDYNMIRQAISKFAENRRDPVAKAKLARVMTVFVAQAVVNAALKSVTGAVRDDDEDESLGEKYAQAFAGNVVDGLNPLSMIPYVSTVTDLFNGYNTSSLDAQAIEKLLQFAEQGYKAAKGESKWSGYMWLRSFASTFGYLSGIGADNLIREFASLYNTAAIQAGGRPLSYQHETATASVAYENMYYAMIGGDKKTFDRIDGKLKADKDSPKSNSDIDTGIGKLMADEDERVQQAWEAKASGKITELNKLRSEMTAELAGMLGKERANEVVDKAITTYGNKVTPKEEEEFDPEKALKVRMYSTKDVAQGVRNFANGTASQTDVKAMLSELVADSEAKDPKKSTYSNVLAEVKPEYIAAAKKGDRTTTGKLGRAMKNLLGVTDKEMDKWVTDSYADDLRTAVDANSIGNAKNVMAKLRARGLDDYDIKDKLSKYRQLYIDAMKRGDRATANNIKRTLMGLGLKYKDGGPMYTESTFTGWMQ